MNLAGMHDKVEWIDLNSNSKVVDITRDELLERNPLILALFSHLVFS